MHRTIAPKTGLLLATFLLALLWASALFAFLLLNPLAKPAAATFPVRSDFSGLAGINLDASELTPDHLARTLADTEARGIRWVRFTLPWDVIAEKEEVANAVAFLASDEAKYITGTELLAFNAYLVDTAGAVNYSGLAVMTSTTVCTLKAIDTAHLSGYAKDVNITNTVPKAGGWANNDVWRISGTYVAAGDA